MSLHHKLIEGDIHTPYRWIVQSENDRGLITTNPNNTPISATNGLHCLCFVKDTKSTYMLSNVSPIEWTSILGNNEYEKITVANLSVPSDSCPVPFSDTAGAFTNVFMRRLSPNIAHNNFNNYKECLWDITEINDSGEVQSSYVAKTFQSYAELITFCNSNISVNSNSNNKNNICISAYLYEKDENPFIKIYGLNRFFSILKGRNNYKSNNVNSKTAQNCNWGNISSFIKSIYQSFLGTNPPPISNALRTLWFPQAKRRIYNHHNRVIEFPSGSVGDRRYYNRTNSTTYSGVNGGVWDYVKSRYYGIDDNGNYQDLYEVIYDNRSVSDLSIIRVSQYASSSDVNKVIFFIKPVGMDIFHLGNSSYFTNKNFSVYVEYGSTDKFTRLHYIKSINEGNVSNEQKYGINTILSIKNSEFYRKLFSSVQNTNLRSKNVVNDVQFRIIFSDNTTIKLSRKLSVYVKQPVINAFVLLN